MSAAPTMIHGIVRGGVVVFDPPATLPEGTEVQVVVGPLPLTPEEQAEFDAWDKLSDEAWNQIDWGEGEIARDSG